MTANRVIGGSFDRDEERFVVEQLEANYENKTQGARNVLLAWAHGELIPWQLIPEQVRKSWALLIDQDPDHIVPSVGVAPPTVR